MKIVLERLEGVRFRCYLGKTPSLPLSHRYPVAVQLSGSGRPTKRTFGIPFFIIPTLAHLLDHDSGLA